MNTDLCHANNCRTSRTILRVACFIASAALLSVNCNTIEAQDRPSDKQQKATEARKASPSDPDDPQSAEKRAKQILDLKDQLLQRIQDGSNEASKAEMGVLTEALTKAALGAQFMQSGDKNAEQLDRALQFLQMKPSTQKMLEQRAQAQQVQQVREQLAEREKQMAMILAEQRRQPLPPLENGQLKVFALGALPARPAAQTIEQLLGTQVLRIAVDERSNSLIVYGKADSLSAVDALLTQLGEQAAPSRAAEKSKLSATAPRSILVRVFWLADNLPEGVGQNPFDFLPDSVIQAAKKLGVVEAPRLITQTVNSLALGREDAVDFSASVPAILFDQPVGLNCQGKIKLVSDDRVRVDMGVHVGGPAANCEINGSLATPLGHYMVLGTANSVTSEGGSAAFEMQGGPGMMGPGGPEGGGFRPGMASRPIVARRAPGEFGVAGGGPPGPQRGPGASATGGREPGGPEGAPPQEKPKFNASRFAFVVQVIEGQSYPAETEKAGNK